MGSIEGRARAPSLCPRKDMHMSADETKPYYWMLLSRTLNRALCAENPRWFPSEGEEATIVGSFYDLKSTDVIAPHYRGPFVTYLMRGADLWRLVCQALGKSPGYNKGRSVPFIGPHEFGIVPWVAGDLGTSIGVATGAALALQQAGSDAVCVCSFGDGTANRGDFHENINLAAIWKLPIVFVCQNNGWSISQPARTYLAAPIVDRAAGYGIPGAAVDGNDIEAVRATMNLAVSRARAGEGPSLVEARTWRVRGHWAADEASYRLTEDDRSVPDPLETYRQRLIERGAASDADFDRIHCTVRRTVDDAIARARTEAEAGLPELGLEEVYA
jgi:acetoin:2,6-dichlorophenolindophenol oxidoreductase subunit alpha